VVIFLPLKRGRIRGLPDYVGPVSGTIFTMFKSSFMKVSFFLKSPKEVSSPVVGRVNWNSKTFKFGIGITVLSRHWDQENQRFRTTTANPENPEQNRFLHKLISSIEGQFLNFVNNNLREPNEAELSDLISHLLPSKRKVRERIEKEIRIQKEAKSQTFFEYYRDFIARSKEGVRFRKGKGEAAAITKATAIAHQSTFRILNEFNPKLDFQDITLAFYNDFNKWLISKNYSVNYIGRIIRNLKTLLSEATSKGIATHPDFKSSYFAGQSEEVDYIYLNESELAEIRAVDLSNNPSLDKVRDLFLIGCFTGQRFSDWHKITPQNINDNSFSIEIVQQKNSTVKKNRVAIPIHPVVKEIFEKYKGQIPPPTSNQKMNDYLKEVARLAPSLQTIETISRTKGGIEVSVSRPKYELVTTHTARRSFATNSYRLGIPSITIMAVTGHKTEKDFLKYIKVSPEDHAKIFEAFWSKPNPEPIMRAI
jgi:integrase